MVILQLIYYLEIIKINYSWVCYCHQAYLEIIIHLIAFHTLAGITYYQRIIIIVAIIIANFRNVQIKDKIKASVETLRYAVY